MEPRPIQQDYRKPWRSSNAPSRNLKHESVLVCNGSTCSYYGLKNYHVDQCRKKLGLYLLCRRAKHTIINYPSVKKSRLKKVSIASSGQEDIPTINIYEKIYGLTSQEPKTSCTMASSTLFLNFIHAHVLFDFGAINFFMATKIPKKLNLSPNKSPFGLTINLPRCKVISCHHLHQNCPKTIAEEILN